MYADVHKGRDNRRMGECASFIYNPNNSTDTAIRTRGDTDDCVTQVKRSITDVPVALFLVDSNFSFFKSLT